MQTIDERIAELMKGNYDPLRADNLAETLANLTTEQVDHISKMLVQRAFDYAGYAMYKLSIQHWERLAASQAQCDEENERLAACARCKGEGCTSCNDLDDDRRENNE